MDKSDTNNLNMHIVVSKNGPYRVSGRIPLQIQEIVSNKDGMSWDWKTGQTFETPNEYLLCRCGQSGNKPFCDNSHLKYKFDGLETASRIPYARQTKNYEGSTLILNDNEKLCAFARFCDPGGKIWGLIERTDIPQARDLVIREATHCPSGRLTLHDRKTNEEIEEHRETSIGIVEDLPLGCSGPLWVQGKIPIESEDGKAYEPRNRVTLCRCGASDNKPFCNGSHASMRFHDGLFQRKTRPL